MGNLIFTAPRHLKPSNITNELAKYKPTGTTQNWARPPIITCKVKWRMFFYSTYIMDTFP